VQKTCSIPILLIEDDDNDVLLFRHALEKNNITAPLFVVPDGEEALQYLGRAGRYSDRGRYPFPGVILIDLKMPRIGGLEVLRWLRKHPECAVIPTIVLSASRIPEDVQEAYRLGANSYFVKPIEFEELGGLIRLMHAYWNRAERPSVPENC
jgi:CheY-like chemotaxis protein